MEALATANCLFIDDNLTEAVLHYQTALESDPQLFIAASNLSAAYLKLGQYSEALQASQKAISINPDSHVGYLRAGLSHFYTEDFQAALPYFDLAEAKLAGSAASWLEKCQFELGKAAA
jgi:tetratricopeptide (TPR) repeat protein